MASDDETTRWRVQGSFYVKALTAAEAEQAVSKAVNSAVVQRLLGEDVGAIDVHNGETEEWDLNG